jgi:hypothetical protein
MCSKRQIFAFLTSFAYQTRFLPSLYAKKTSFDEELGIELETRGVEAEHEPQLESFTPPTYKRLNKCYIASAVVSGILLIVFAIIVIVHIKNAPPKYVH